MLLQHQTWKEVDIYLQDSDLIIFPIGSTEQHGPTGLLGTDAMTAEAVAQRTGVLAETLVAPTISVGMALHHLAFPGSLSVRPSTLIAMLIDQIGALARHGFRRFFFINGHGGNIATLNAAFAEATAAITTPARGRGDNSDTAIRCTLLNWWDPEPVKALCREFYGDADGSHATASEIAMTQHLFPQSIKPIPQGGLQPSRAPSGGFFGAEDFRRRYPDGRIGSDPSLATPAHGAQLLEVAARAAAERVRAFAVAP